MLLITCHIYISDRKICGFITDDEKFPISYGLNKNSICKINHFARFLLKNWQGYFLLHTSNIAILRYSSTNIFELFNLLIAALGFIALQDSKHCRQLANIEINHIEIGR